MAMTSKHGGNDEYDVPTKLIPPPSVIQLGHLPVPSPRREGDAADGAGDYSARQPVAADHRYISNLIYATFSLLVHIMDVITSLILVAAYFGHGGLDSAAISLIIIHVARALTQILFEWTNHGRCRYLLLDLLWLRPIAEYWRYVHDWRLHYGRPWRRREFRSTCSFETFITSMPSLIVQTYVFILDGYFTTIQMVAFFTAIILAFIELLHHFNYVTVNASTYATQMTKAVFNSVIRTTLVALLVSKLASLVWAFVLLSYIFGCIIYYRSVRLAAINRQDDDPLHHSRCHLVYGNLVAMTMLFVSFPFGVTHSVYDWWYGYLASEMKMLLENIIMIVYVMYDSWTSDTYSRESFYAAIFLIAMVMLLNFVGLAMLHSRVKRYFSIVRRNLYTTSLIVHLFAHICRHLKYKIDGRYPDDDHYREGGGRAPEGLIKVFPAAAPSTGGTHEDMTALLHQQPTDENKEQSSTGGGNGNGGNTVIAIGSAGVDQSPANNDPTGDHGAGRVHVPSRTSHSRNGHGGSSNDHIALIGAVDDSTAQMTTAPLRASSSSHTHGEPKDGHGHGRRPSLVSNLNNNRPATTSNGYSTGNGDDTIPSEAPQTSLPSSSSTTTTTTTSRSPKVTRTTITTTTTVISSKPLSPTHGSNGHSSMVASAVDEPETESSVEVGVHDEHDRAAVVAVNTIAPPPLSSQQPHQSAIKSSTSSTPLMASPSIDEMTVDPRVMMTIDAHSTNAMDSL